MKLLLLAAVLPALSISAAVSCGENCACPGRPATCCAATPASDAGEEVLPGHPLRGVVLEVLPEKKSLLVKHEEVPGVMAAMTMQLRVDDATLASARKGQAIVARLAREDGVWWIRQVKPAAPPASP